MTDPRIILTPQGAVAAALSIVAEQASEVGAWWRNSTLLSGLGVTAELEGAGWVVIPEAEIARLRKIEEAARALVLVEPDERPVAGWHVRFHALRAALEADR
jgi:hypothetical protein